MMLLGSSVWAYVITSGCSILATLDPYGVQYRHMMDELNHFARDKKLPNEMRFKLRSFLTQTQTVGAPPFGLHPKATVSHPTPPQTTRTRYSRYSYHPLSWLLAFSGIAAPSPITTAGVCGLDSPGWTGAQASAV